MLEMKPQVSLASFTSWLVGGNAEFFCRPKTIDEIKEAQKWAQDKKLQVTILSGGSNVLISDEGIKGLVISLKDFSSYTTAEENGKFIIRASSGMKKSELLKNYLKNQLEPALFLAGIPGDVGGGVVMNAGVSENMKPREFVEITEAIDVLKPDGKIQTYRKSDLDWSYRHCEGWKPGIIVGVTLSWPAQKHPEILTQVREANKVRLSKQPLDLPSCGSVFKNPEGFKSAQLIDSCGLKGFQIGDAQVSLKHANFIVNLNQAKANDIWSVIQHVQKTVLEKKNVSLKTEVVRLGSFESAR